MITLFAKRNSNTTPTFLDTASHCGLHGRYGPFAIHMRVVNGFQFPGNYMHKFWLTAVIVYTSLFLISTQASAANVFSYAQINVPFDVRVDGTWVKVIESRDAWEAFYKENARKYLAPESELNIPPQFDFDAYTVIAGGLGAGGAGRSLMIEYVKGGGSTTYVGALILRSDGGCSVTANVTYPTIVILIPKPEGRLQLFSREAVFFCK